MGAHAPPDMAALMTIQRAAQRKTIADRQNDEKWEELFQQTIEAIHLFGERPDDLLSGFVNALRTGEFARPRPLDPCSDHRSDERAATGGASRTPVRRYRA
jgi:hypothetical protein